MHIAWRGNCEVHDWRRFEWVWTH